MKAYLHRQHSLRQRILAVFMLCMLSTLLCVGGVMGFSYTQLVEKRVNAAYEAAADQFTLSLENLISGLNHVSQQLAYSESIRLSFEKLFTATDSYERIQAHDALKQTANYAVFSNPLVGLYAYAVPDGSKLYLSNALLSGERTAGLTRQNVIFQYSGATYYGVFPSQNGYTNNPVIAIARELEVSGQPIMLYLETGFRAVADLLSSYSLEGTHFLLLNNEGRVVYEQGARQDAGDTSLSVAQLASRRVRMDGSVLFLSMANQGWYAAISVESRVYHREMNSLITGMLVIALLLLCLFILFSIMLWRRIYRPLARFDAMIGGMLTDGGAVVDVETGILEYDRLIGRFQHMRGELQAMLGTVRRQEQVNAQMMVSRLRSQINPHFLMNTLNTVHWMALLKGETEIDDVVLALNRLLAYNLRQGNELATLKDEIDAVEQYIHLQSNRYAIEHQVVVEPEGASVDVPFPKFVLQPLVENSLYHGYRENMRILLHIRLDDRIRVSVEDDGIGMSPESLAVLKAHLSGNGYDEAEKRTGMGIGLRYVVKTLHMVYPNDVQFSVESEPGRYTKIGISVPREVSEHDEPADR